MESEHFKSSIGKYVDSQIGALNLLRDFNKFSFNKIPINCCDISYSYYENLKKEYGLLNSNPVLYYFKIASKHDGKEIQTKIDTLKKSSPEKRSFPKINKVNQITDNRTLYIGKTNYNFVKRLEQHLGLTNLETTYALHLSDWAKVMNLNLELHYMEFTSIEGDILEHIESALHYEFKPLLGRRGH